MAFKKSSTRSLLVELGRERMRRHIARRLPEVRAQEGDRIDIDALISLHLASWAKPLMQPSRYKCLWGGRGSGKSYAAADALLLTGIQRKIRVLCAREFQVSIKDSVHHLLRERIDALGLGSRYWVQRDRILGTNGSEFIFKGVRHNVQSIKSTSALTHCWIEEAQTISAESWQILIPTIREPNSEIWVTFNPLNETDVVYQELVVKGRDRAYVQKVNWDRNPWFPAVLDEERRAMQRTDQAAYQHVWEGGFWEQSDAQILHGKWVVDEFEPQEHWGGPYYGADFGFAQDPSTLVRCWFDGDAAHGSGTLYVEHESWAIALELDDMPARWKADVPECDRHPVKADNSRPESIAYLRRHGIDYCEPCRKWPGSVEDGIAFLRSLNKIVIHPRCTKTAEEARLWRYKTDRYTGEVLPAVQPGQDHLMDAIRYGCAPLIEARNTGWLGVV
ncbi:PBSX family phage terminase large subunit [Thermoleptolyngbya sp. M55_K2018_002]|uniref:PBSX family phage terminase large subunit n=1 Tax=Thermoleptolyngbya sp. M55_K2018_002 TaxID=2747808 RepID=UPI00260140D8|nr:PBSX family phage terminase large subunit [Thermoleptolyngbya sp. M55_K2018_002]